MSQSTATFPLSGGLDLISPPGRMQPGRCIAALNYEPIASGYARFQGFERFDGHVPAPSDATWWRLDYTSGQNGGAAPTTGTIIKDTSGSASTHTVGYIVAVVTTSGAWATDNAAGYFIATGMTANLAGTTGWFSTAPAPVRNFSCTAQTLEYDFGAVQNAAYLLAAQTLARSRILAVTGSGAIRGIWGFGDNIFAFRDDAGATTGVMYKATTAGWVAATNLVRIDFTCDTATQVIPLTKDHNDITNSSGGATKGHVETVVITGTVGTVNTGYLLVSSYTAGTFTAGAQTIYKSGTAIIYGTTTAAATTTATVPPGGRYFFLNHNFYGAANREAMYMVNGVGRGLVYNGTGYAEIVTGMTTDTPTRLAEHQGALFLAFPGGSLQFSETGEPLVWNAILGAGEIGVGSEITDLIQANKTTLALLAERSISALYGHDATDYQLEKLIEAEGDDAVALPYTAQRVGTPLYMDNVGIRSISSTAAYGNFSLGTLSRLIEPLLRDYRVDGVNPVASFVWKRKDQYWVFFDNSTALVVYLGTKEPQILPLNLGFTVTCATAITIDGIERAFVGTSTGYVMEIDKGTSFDGSAIEHYIRLPFNSFGSPQVDKRVHKIQVSLEASGTTTLSVAVDMDFGAVQAIPSQELVVTTGGGAIDDLGSNELYYASQIETVAEAWIDGVAKNFSLKISGETSTEEPHTLIDVTYHASQRRLVR